jgi:hypothetical protein
VIEGLIEGLIDLVIEEGCMGVCQKFLESVAFSTKIVKSWVGELNCQRPIERSYK